MQLECCQTEVEFVRRRLKQSEEKLDGERHSRQQLEAKVRQDAGARTETPARGYTSERTQRDGSCMRVCVCVCVSPGGYAPGPGGAVQTERDRTETSLSPRDLRPPGRPGPH